MHIHITLRILTLYGNLLRSIEHIDEQYLKAIPMAMDLALHTISLAPEELQARSFSLIMTVLIIKRNHIGLDKKYVSNMIRNLYAMYHELYKPNIDIIQYVDKCDVRDVLSVWKLRIACQRSEISRLLNVAGWYVCIYTYTCIYMHTCTHIYIYIYMYVYFLTHIFAHMNIRIGVDYFKF